MTQARRGRAAGSEGEAQVGPGETADAEDTPATPSLSRTPAPGRLPGAPGAPAVLGAAGATEVVRVRLTLGPALIDLEASMEQMVVLVTRLTQEFSAAAIISTTPTPPR